MWVLLGLNAGETFVALYTLAKPNKLAEEGYALPLTPLVPLAWPLTSPLGSADGHMIVDLLELALLCCCRSKVKLKVPKRGWEGEVGWSYGKGIAVLRTSSMATTGRTGGEDRLASKSGSQLSFSSRVR